ncbi:hypothetical protein ABB37_02374 [Leptomonas pyrrhocoris]|uniref:Uncharacterized protein n=1 Tax=Leptomonas pyrrhocoris TaxID=157538 RepID=A0A0M9G845_LEPPY|nr:hypothetical protein ABB37_02374 [Leptomonas pyrrhocoris]KPA84389.1 hypothetical protein ABB37_02374 [Leptomonas pyrrhocoris]|eukprot:XP_015662828.1 hypothetical protein ABB37_02374 [Leptomonas pyrrhocoris]
MIRTSPNGVAAGRGNSRVPKPRPQPLDLPRDPRYGTMDITTIANGSPAGSRRGSRQDTRGSTETVPLLNYLTSPHSPLIQIRDHCHQQWVAVVLTLLLLAITTYFVFGLSAPMRADHCVTPYGTLLGENGNIGAFSNCRRDYGGDRMDHFVSVGLQRLYTGSKWHALEYARRYWILSSLLTFPFLPSADHLMTVETANAVNGRRGGRGSLTVALEHYTNLFLPTKAMEDDEAAAAEATVVLANIVGNASNASARALLMNRRLAMPVPRDLIVYARNRRTLPEAHVAVVVAVRGPFRSLAAAGKDVHWYLVKNTSSAGRQPLSPVSALPHELLAKDRAAATAVTGGEKAKEEASAGSGVLYYKVYVAEQNWDNIYWKATAVEDDHDNSTQRRSLRQMRKSSTKQRSYARVLLLHEYAKPHGFFLEDTHNNLILGWVRAPSAETSG